MSKNGEFRKKRIYLITNHDSVFSYVFYFVCFFFLFFLSVFSFLINNHNCVFSEPCFSQPYFPSFFPGFRPKPGAPPQRTNPGEAVVWKGRKESRHRPTGHASVA